MHVKGGTTDHEKNYHTPYYNKSGEQRHHPLGVKLSRKGETSVCIALIGLDSNGQLTLSSSSYQSS